MKDMILADATAFAGYQVNEQIFDPDVRLDILGLTAAHPSPAYHRTLAAIREQVIATVASLTTQPDRVFVIRNLADLHRVRTDNRMGVFLTLQCPPEDQLPSVEALKELRELGVLFMTLAYDTENRYGSGFADPIQWLTPDGEELMRRCAKAGITIDLAHANHRTAESALDVAHRCGLPPVVATHTASYDLYPHPRNLPDLLLQRIAEQGGFVGVLSLTSFLHDDTTKGDLQAFIEHVDHIQRLCSFTRTAIGSDGYYRTRNLVQWKYEHEQLTGAINAGDTLFGVIRWPDQPLLLNTPKRMQTIRQHLRRVMGATKSGYVCGKTLHKYLDMLLRRVAA